MMISQAVQESSRWQSHKHTHKQTDTRENSTIFSTLSLRGWLGKRKVSGSKS